MPAALAVGAEGVGLFRTEFLYLGSDEPPTFDAQVKAYKDVFDAFPEGARIVVRTLDAGADKPLPFVPLGEEPNPALGVRGLRAFRAFEGRNESVLRTQLVAIREAAGTSAPEVWVMAPMVDEATEAEWFCDLAAACDLDVAGGRVGIMVETPASALTAGPILSGRTGFASIGTNDLTQYTMAADRMLGAVGALQDPWHPAVLKLVGAAGAAGRGAGKPVGVCGEAAADPLLRVRAGRAGSAVAVDGAPGDPGSARGAGAADAGELRGDGGAGRRRGHRPGRPKGRRRPSATGPLSVGFDHGSVAARSLAGTGGHHPGEHPPRRRAGRPLGRAAPALSHAGPSRRGCWTAWTSSAGTPTTWRPCASRHGSTTRCTTAARRAPTTRS